MTNGLPMLWHLAPWVAAGVSWLHRPPCISIWLSQPSLFCLAVGQSSFIYQPMRATHIHSIQKDITQHKTYVGFPASHIKTKYFEDRNILGASLAKLLRTLSQTQVDSNWERHSKSTSGHPQEHHTYQRTSKKKKTFWRRLLVSSQLLNPQIITQKLCYLNHCLAH